jgi:hypothetical protein
MLGLDLSAGAPPPTLSLSLWAAPLTHSYRLGQTVRHVGVAQPPALR